MPKLYMAALNSNSLTDIIINTKKGGVHALLSDQMHGGIMSAETLKILSYIGYALSICFLITGIALFFALGIKNTINELSGRAQKKAVEQIRRKNAGENKKRAATADANVRDSSEDDTVLLEYGKTDMLSGPQTDETVILEQLSEYGEPEHINYTIDVDILMTEGAAI